MSQIPDDFPEIDWPVAPDPREIARLRELAKLPLWEKLQWLETAQEMVESMSAQQAQQAREDSAP